MALREHGAGVVDERDAAGEPLAEDREQLVDALPVDDGLREALVHLERLRRALQLLVREVAEGGLRERDERGRVRHREQREAEPVGLGGDGGRDLVDPEPEPDPEPGEAVRGEAADVGALRGRAAAEAEPRRQQQLAALEPRRRVGELGDVHPAHVVVEPAGPARDRELETGHGGDLADGEHSLEPSLGLDRTGQERYASERLSRNPGSTARRTSGRR